MAGYAREIAVNKIRKAHDINNLNEESDEHKVMEIGSMVINEHEAVMEFLGMEFNGTKASWPSWTNLGE